MFRSPDKTKRAWRVLALSIVMALASCLVSCGVVVSFDDYGTATRPKATPATTTPDVVLYGVRGTVDGLAGATLTLHEDGLTLDVKDGPFTFPATLVDGASWAVTLGANPTDRTCTIDGARGIIAKSDGSGVAVHCASAVATLDDLRLSAAALVPAFAKSTAAYRTEPVRVLFGPHTTTVTPTATDPAAHITVNGSAVGSGQPFGPIELRGGPTVLDVAVTAPDGRTNVHYAVVVSINDYLKPEATPTPDGPNFGASVAISGDTLAVGANGTSQSTGSVLVFTRVGSKWTLQATLGASNARPAAYFGGTVAISGDTIVVGAAGETSAASGVNGDQSAGPLGDPIGPPGLPGGPPGPQPGPPQGPGAAYVFRRAGTTWSQEAYLKPSNTTSLPRQMMFGSSVSISGDTIAVGAPGEPSSSSGVNGDQSSTDAPGAGAVYVFTRAAGTWSQQAYLKASNSLVASSFGLAVALAGDLLAVGAPGEASGKAMNVADPNDTSAPRAGAAYVFVRSGATWAQDAYVKASNPRENASFGTGVALGPTTLVVTAPGERSNATGVNGDQTNELVKDAGAAYVFERAGATWVQQAYLKAANSRVDDEGEGSQLGGKPFIGPMGPGAVALAGDLLLVGAFDDSTDAFGIDAPLASNASVKGAGAAYLYARTGTTWSQRAMIKASNSFRQTFFGTSVALAADTVVVGAIADCGKPSGVNGDPTALPAWCGTGAVHVY